MFEFSMNSKMYENLRILIKLRISTVVFIMRRLRCVIETLTQSQNRKKTRITKVQRVCILFRDRTKYKAQYKRSHKSWQIFILRVNENK